MNLKVKLDEGAKMPTKAHEEDAGFDLYSREDKTIKARSGECFDTGVHIGIPNGMVGFLKSKSGLNVRHCLLGEGVIDAGYTGPIVVKLYNHSDQDYEVKQGDKISQIVFLPIPEISLTEATELEESERGEGGFGSTGR